MHQRIVLSVTFDRETDGRWIAEAAGIPGMSPLLVYGDSRDEALRNVVQLALEVIAEQLKHGELEPASVEFAEV